MYTFPPFYLVFCLVYPFTFYYSGTGAHRIYFSFKPIPEPSDLTSHVLLFSAVFAQHRK